MRPVTVLDQLPPASLGEGPWWDVQTQCLYWVDITGHAVHRFEPASGRHDRHAVGGLTGFALLDVHGAIVAGLRDGIYTFEFGGTERRCLALAPHTNPENRFNDGKCDRQGRLWAGTMNLDTSAGKAPSGALYRLRPGGLETVEVPVGISNGLGWSPSGTRLYYSDTRARTIWEYDYGVETGEATNRRIFAAISADQGVPDGLTVDSSGRVFSAIWGGACLNVYSAGGHLQDVLSLPVPRPTSCCFGGPNLTTLFITTAIQDMSPQQRADAPASGHILSVDMETPGLPEARFQPLR